MCAFIVAIICFKLQYCPIKWQYSLLRVVDRDGYIVNVSINWISLQFIVISDGTYFIMELSGYVILLVQTIDDEMKLFGEFLSATYCIAQSQRFLWSLLFMTMNVRLFYVISGNYKTVTIIPWLYMIWFR